MNQSNETIAARLKEWQPGMVVQMGAVYRDRETGENMELTDVSCTDNFLRLRPLGTGWYGTSQEFAKRFVLVCSYEDKDKPRPGASDDECRRQFEALYGTIEGSLLVRAGEGYSRIETDRAWNAFRAGWHACGKESA